MISIMRHGGLFFFDEINMVNAGIISTMNNILDDTKTYTIPETGETVSCHNNFRYCEAFNVGAGYEGTKDMNLSHKSRVQDWHKMTKKTEENEANIVSQETGIDKEIALKMVKAKDTIANTIFENGDESTQRVDLRNCISWAHKTMDLGGDVIRASLTTILALLAMDVDDVYGSGQVNDFAKSGDIVVSSAMNVIKKAFTPAKPKIPEQNFTFETYELN